MNQLKQYNALTGAIRPVVLLALLALSAILTWLLWPLRMTLEGSGTVQPRFEKLVRVTPGESGMVCRVMTARLQQVQAGEPLFEYIPSGKFSVLSYVRMTPPGGGDLAPEPLPEWRRNIEHERIARIEAANRWSSRVISQSSDAYTWERDLSQRLASTIPREMDLVLLQEQQRENTRLDRDNANKVYTFNEVIGESVAAAQGIPITSPVRGTIYSLWVQPQTQIFGSPAATPPMPPPGGPPGIALHASTSSPVAEIMLPDTPLEVLGLIPVPPRSLVRASGWKASLLTESQDISIPAAVTKVEIGQVSIAPTDAGLIMPELPVSRESVFVRLGLPTDQLRTSGSMVRLKAISPQRPRVWFWLHGIWDTDL